MLSIACCHVSHVRHDSAYTGFLVGAPPFFTGANTGFLAGDLTGVVFTGALTGDLTGALTGDLTGALTGVFTGVTLQPHTVGMGVVAMIRHTAGGITPYVPPNASCEQVTVFPANENEAVGNVGVWPAGQMEHFA